MARKFVSVPDVLFVLSDFVMSSVLDSLDRTLATACCCFEARVDVLAKPKASRGARKGESGGFKEPMGSLRADGDPICAGGFDFEEMLLLSKASIALTTAGSKEVRLRTMEGGSGAALIF